MVYKFQVSTQKRYELINITNEVEKFVSQVSKNSGAVLIFVPHSTAGIVLTEDEEGLKKDWLNFFKKIISAMSFEHNLIDDNADSHLLAGIVGQSKILPIENGKLELGSWQSVFLAEFDGPRQRTVELISFESS